MENIINLIDSLEKELKFFKAELEQVEKHIFFLNEGSFTIVKTNSLNSNDTTDIKQCHLAIYKNHKLELISFIDENTKLIDEQKAIIKNFKQNYKNIVK